MSDQNEDQTEAELERTREAAAATAAEQATAADAIIPVEDLPEPEDDADDEIDLGWDAYSKDELTDELRRRELAVSGNKDELVARLNESDAAGYEG